MLIFNTPISQLTRVGKVTAKQLAKLGIETAEDLIFYFPFRYEDFSRVLPIANLTPDIDATIRGRVDLIKNRRSPVKKKILTEAIISDNTGSIKVVWFNQPFLIKNIKPGDSIFLAGRVNYDYREIEFINPTYELARAGQTINTAGIVPVYHLTEKLTQKQLRFLINYSLQNIKDIDDYLPEELIERYDFITLKESLKQIHFPESGEALEKAKKRLKFDELFLIQLSTQQSKYLLKNSNAVSLKIKEDAVAKFVEQLPYQLTDDQRRAAWEIIKDLEKKSSMNRMLEGDVGSGKTIVVAIAILNVVLNGYNVVYMAPTEILARQHFETFCKLFANFDIKIGLINRTEKKINRDGENKKVLDSKFIIQNSDIIIGTHALIQEKIEFFAKGEAASGGKNLALAIIDEQHRFGVKQRKLLKEKSGDKKNTPHFLSMTATPIPRSLALTLYGDLDLSIIKEMPKGRKKILTKIVDSKNRKKAYQFIKDKIKDGQQVFVVCPLINPSDKLGVKSVREEYEKLNKIIFPKFTIAMMHGRLKGEEKEKIMKDFLENKINILVSTSVIEVGIDIPNATIMMIEGAERFGLAQLHQFRGRVGRGEHQSYCLLFSDNLSDEVKKRLNALVESSDGFALAEKDLKLRGPGEVYGIQQSGMIDLKIAKLTDWQIIKQARQEAENIIFSDVELKKYPELKNWLKLAEKTVHLE